jgi:conjugative relaxase-like TrwC/TraI family protein
MIRMHQSTSAADAKAYYTQGLAREDYYTQGQSVLGYWLGDGARLLGLAEHVDRESFAALIDNTYPEKAHRLRPHTTLDENTSREHTKGNRSDSGTLTSRTRDGRTVGYDISWHPPKSVSVAYALTNDPAIPEALRAAVRATMAEMEAEMLTRVRVGGQDTNRRVGNLVWAEFLHTTSRPVKRYPADPHVHLHTYVMNAVYDPVEGRWKAGQFREMQRDMPYWQSLFHARLADGLRAAGYNLRATAKGWELAHVPESVIARFSKRTQQIESLARDKGITRASEKAALGARTRRTKSYELSDTELRRAWDAQLLDGERSEMLRHLHQHPGHRRAPGVFVGVPRTVDDCLAYATTHLFERQSVVQTRRLLAEAIAYGVGRCDTEAIIKGITRDGFINRTMDGIGMTTTSEVLAEEERMLAFAWSAKGTCRPLAQSPPDAPQSDAHTLKPAVSRLTLADDQQRALDHVLSCTDRIMAIRGAAGTGKTTLLTQLKSRLEEVGRRVHAFAPTAEASRGVLREAGFEDADTLDRLLVDRKLQSSIKGGVVILDEASLVGVTKMNRMFDLVEQLDLRLVLSGDTRQHAAVDRGDALRALETEAGIVPAQVTTIRRQRGELKKAVEHLSRGEIAEGFSLLDTLGCIQTTHDPESRLKNLAVDYAEALRSGKSVLAIAPTHAEGQDVTAAIREKLRDSGVIKGDEKTYRQLIDLGWTKTQRGMAERYEPGMVVQFTNHVRGFARGGRWEVASVDREHGRVQVRDGDGKEQLLPMNRADRFAVCAQRSLELAEGDRIRITRNGAAVNRKTASSGRTTEHRLMNGSLYGIRRVLPDGSLELSNGWVIDRDFGHIAHGYCQTSHAVQGKSADRVLVAQSSESFAASSPEQFYVSCSRAKESLTVYTDSAPDLLIAIRQHVQRPAATTLAKEGAIKRPAHWGLAERHREHFRTMTRLAYWRDRTLARLTRQSKSQVQTQEPLRRGVSVPSVLGSRIRERRHERDGR